MSEKSPRIIDEYELRAEALTTFVRGATWLLETRPELASVQLGVTQLYCDEAYDAVHATLQLSRTWQTAADEPHEDVYPRPFHLGWDENNLSVYAFAAMCKEGDPDYGEDAAVDAVSPVISVHRCADGAMRPAWLGALHRPWLDFPGAQRAREYFWEYDFAAPIAQVAQEPRALWLAALVDRGARDVLADRWIADDDPRGHFAVAQRTGDRAAMAALVRRHGRSWLGALAAVVPLAGARFGDGAFCEHAIVYADHEHWGDAPEWGSVRALEFAPTSLVRITPAMRSLRSVGPLLPAHLPMLAGHAIDDLDLVGLAPFPPTVRTLSVRTAEPVEIPASPQLEAVQLWVPSDWSPERAAALLSASRAPCRMEVGILHGAQRTGLLFDGATLRVLQPDGRPRQGWETLAPLPTFWEPDPALPDWLALGLGLV